MKPVKTNDQIISYLTLRILIGAVGVLLPFLMIIGKLIANNSWEVENSISDYYDNGTAGDILVGELFVLGFFLFTYKGYSRTDDRIADLGGTFALGVALFPDTTGKQWVSIVHLSCALLLFTIFIIFSLWLFRKTDPNKTPTHNKEMRNRVYLICGIIMIIAVVGLFVSMLWLQPYTNDYNLVFWLESLALISFGFSWITKSEYLFWKDR